MEISLKVRELRKSLKLTQEGFAQKLGVSPKTIAFWENGNNVPTKNNLLTICNKCNLSENYFDENVKNENKIVGSSDIVKIPYWNQLPDELKNPDFTCVTAERNVILNHWYLKPENLCIVPMVDGGLSNYWYKITSGDILIIDLSHNNINQSGVYFCTSMNNTRFWVREIKLLINESVEFHNYSMTGEIIKTYTQEQLNAVDFKIIGKVIKNVSFRL